MTFDLALQYHKQKLQYICLIVDQSKWVECPLETSVSIPAISKACLSHLEIVEEETGLCSFNETY